MLVIIFFTNDITGKPLLYVPKGHLWQITALVAKRTIGHRGQPCFVDTVVPTQKGEPELNLDSPSVTKALHT